MDKNKIDDKYISQLVCSIEHDEPTLPEINFLKKSKLKTNKNIIYIIRTIAATLILLIGTLLINNPDTANNKDFIEKSDIKEISEIRTDFVLRGENIKIIWIQKKNFKINQKVMPKVP